MVALFFLFPYLIMIIGAFKSRAEILRVPPTYLPEEWHPENFLDMWSTPETPLPYNMVSTVVISVCATLLVLVVAMPAAYYTARHRFPGRLGVPAAGADHADAAAHRARRGPVPRVPHPRASTTPGWR